MLVISLNESNQRSYIHPKHLIRMNKIHQILCMLFTDGANKHFELLTCPLQKKDLSTYNIIMLYVIRAGNERYPWYIQETEDISNKKIAEGILDRPLID